MHLDQLSENEKLVQDSWDFMKGVDIARPPGLDTPPAYASFILLFYLLGFLFSD